MSVIQLKSYDQTAALETMSQKERQQYFSESIHALHLTEQQKQAITATDGPVLLLAVPGSGKTTVLVTRIGYMILIKSIAPERILTLTYTVAATRDMKNRFASFFGTALAERLSFRTINGLSAGIIRYFGQKIGREPFRLLNDEKQLSQLLGRIYQSTEKTYATEADLKNVRTLITYIKNRMLTSAEIKALEDTTDIHISKIYEQYQQEMRSNGFMDFDDQMSYALAILNKSPETLRYFQNRFPYILVDEAQDTSKIQHAIIRLLSGRDNLFMVGDEDQSIYGFRAAYPEALLHFENDHPGAKVLLMEQNFRSQASIVSMADRFIHKNMLRHEKTIRPTLPAAKKPAAIPVKSRTAQYSYLIKVAAHLQEDTAVLYRDNESALPLIDLLDRNKLPFRMKGNDLSFFTNRVILDVTNIIRFALDPYNTELFQQIYYKLKLYLSKPLAMQACQMATQHRLPVLDAALRYVELPKNTENNIHNMRSHLNSIPHDQADQAINRITGAMGYSDYLDHANLSDSKLYILRTLSYQESSAESLLNRLAELQTMIQEKRPQPIRNEKDSYVLSGTSAAAENSDLPSLTLSTIHGSKGLEYHTVYLMDVFDGIFPDVIPDIALKSDALRKTATGEDLEELEHYEEERRLFYVGATRAKQNLYFFDLERETTTFINEYLNRPPSVSREFRFPDSAVSKRSKGPSGIPSYNFHLKKR